MVLRSKTPDGAMQELYGHLCTHYPIRALMSSAADHQQTDPDRISFTRTLRAARRSARAGIGTTTNLATALLHAITEIVHELLPTRRLRTAPRVVKRKLKLQRETPRPPPLATTLPRTRPRHPRPRTPLTERHRAKDRIADDAVSTSDHSNHEGGTHGHEGVLTG